MSTAEGRKPDRASGLMARPAGAPAREAGDTAREAKQKPTRPVLRWHGGKWKLAPWIIGHFPPHRIYVEPYGGAASVLLRKERSPFAEVYNDLDDEVVNVFRVLQDRPAGEELVRLLSLTPFSRAEFERAFESTDGAIERARRLVVRSFFAGGSRGVLQIDRVNAGFNGGSARARGGNPQPSHAHDWRGYPAALAAIVDRFSAVTIESRHALEVLRQHDGADTLFYVDPPYLWSTRSKGNRFDIKHYRHELTDDDHVALLDALDGLQGMVVLSGYPAPLYDDRLGHWRRVETRALADGARERTEVLWLNPACAAALDAAREQNDLFAGAGA